MCVENRGSIYPNSQWTRLSTEIIILTTGHFIVRGTFTLLFCYLYPSFSSAHDAQIYVHACVNFFPFSRIKNAAQLRN